MPEITQIRSYLEQIYTNPWSWSAGPLHFVPWRVTILGLQHGTWFMSTFWRLEFWNGSYILENLCTHCLKLIMCTVRYDCEWPTRFTVVKRNLFMLCPNSAIVDGMDLKEKELLFPYTILRDWFDNQDRVCLLRGTSWIFKHNSVQS